MSQYVVYFPAANTSLVNKVKLLVSAGSRFVSKLIYYLYHSNNVG